MKRFITILFIVLPLMMTAAHSQKILIPMDMVQTDHLKAYGITYRALEKGIKADWLLNYRGGSFMLDYDAKLADECYIRGVYFEKIDGASAAQIYAEVKSDKNNMDAVVLEKAPKIAVYAPPGTQPWDDAVLLALDYAEVKHDIIWDEEVLNGKIDQYDWLHLHHEDFTGQYGKFWASFHNAPWYIQQVTLNEAMAKKLGFAKVSELKLAKLRILLNLVCLQNTRPYLVSLLLNLV
jgi:hypothetical protein